MRKTRGIAAVATVTVAALAGVGVSVAVTHNREAYALPTASTYAPGTMPTVAQSPASRTPILILATDAQDRRWHVTEAVEAWNEATGCDLLTTEPDGRAHLTYRLVEKVDIENAGYRVGAETIWPWDDAHEKRIYVDPEWAGTPHVVVHEVGHTLKIQHTTRPDEVMSGLWNADRSTISAHEAGLAIAKNLDRCGSGTHTGHDVLVDR